MPRKLALYFSFVSLGVVAAITVACGGSSNSTPKACTGGPYNVVGDWQVTVSDIGGGSGMLYGAIDSSGLGLFFDYNLVSGSGDSVEMPTISGSCSFSGNITAYPEPSPISGSPVVDAAQGNVTSNTSITGSFTGTNGDPSGTFTATACSPLTGAVAAINGDKTGSVQGSINGQPVLLPATFTPSGSNNSMSFTTSTIPNCTVSGTFTEVGTSNVFDVSMTFAGTGCAITGTFTGIGFESSSDYFSLNGSNPDTYLYADILASNNTFVVEFF
jgi:hypothetical protein